MAQKQYANRKLSIQTLFLKTCQSCITLCFFVVCVSFWYAFVSVPYSLKASVPKLHFLISQHFSCVWWILLNILFSMLFCLFSYCIIAKTILQWLFWINKIAADFGHPFPPLYHGILWFVLPIPDKIDLHQPQRHI